MNRTHPTNTRSLPGAWLALVALLMAGLACGQVGVGGIPARAVRLQVSATADLQPWLDQAAQTFNDRRIKSAGGEPYYVILEYAEAGAVVSKLAGSSAGETARPDLWVPDGPAWTSALAQAGLPDYQGDCASLAQSPLVIALWRPAAEALGWPGRRLGWLDIGSLAADPGAWAYYSGGQFGPALRLGHTHPGLSGSGAATLLALVQAAQGKTEPVSAAEVEQPVVAASVGAFESAVTWFSPSAAALGRALQQRGTGFLGAAVVYESTVVQYGEGDPPLVAVYPFEGTFMATFPACVNAGAAPEAAAGARSFREFLLSAEGQAAALVQGLRPASASAPFGAPLDAAHGVDPSEPQVRFAEPGVEALYAVQTLWQAARKEVNLVMLLDASGSMRGEKIENVKRAAVQFVRQMGQDDYLTLIAIDQEPLLLARRVRLGEAREALIAAIASLQAGGSTPLYDAIAAGAAVLASSSSPETTNALVLLSDGRDTASTRYSFNQDLIDLAAAHGTTVFTIAYGNDADAEMLAQLAERANGNFYQGDEANIAAIYEEMSAAFGGSAGIGR
jgi:Ca-activated chloride channel family protein